MPPAVPAVLCAGCLVADEIFRLPALPVGDGKFFASERRRAMGGMAAAAAATISALGAKSALWAVVGDDHHARFLQGELRRLGVRPRLLRRPDTASAFSAVCLDPDGRRMIVNRAPPRLFAPPPRESRIPSLRGFQAVLADIRWPGGAIRALRAARQKGIPAVLDWETAPDPKIPALQKLARAATHVVFSSDGLRQFAEFAANAKGKFRPVPALRAAAEFSRARVAATRGENGVLFLRPDGSAGIIPAPRVAAASTLGAGDAFHGALALALAEGADFENGLAFAAAVAAAKCAKPAGRFPSRREAEKFRRRISAPSAPAKKS